MSGLGDMGNLLKQAQEMQRALDRVKAELRAKVVEGRAGGGVVRIEISADRHDVKAIHVTAEVLRMEDPKLLEDLLVAAVQDGLRKAEALEKESMGAVTGGMHLPGLF